MYHRHDYTLHPLRLRRHSPSIYLIFGLALAAIYRSKQLKNSAARRIVQSCTVATSLYSVFFYPSSVR